MSVLIFDSNGELWHTRAEELGLDFISMPYYIGGQEYFYDLGKETDFRKFYDAVRGGEIPRVSVKTAAAVPKEAVFAVMAQIHTLTLDAPVRAGQVLLPDAAATGVPLVATKTVARRGT